MCNQTFTAQTNNEEINCQAVQGTIGIGIGYRNAQELFSVLDIPFMPRKVYERSHSIVSNQWQKTAAALMRAAAKEEARYAIEQGSIDTDGVPLINVVADGCWSKRSYKTNYSALSGAAAIVGQHTGKVLYLGVKNKYCSFCNYHQNKGETPPHACFKNYSGSSSGMESQTIAEGFKCSEAMYGIRYAKLIADGDSSTYKKILEVRPYKTLTVEKIECRNHLLRNFCNKLKALTTETTFPVQLRKLLSNNILRFRGAIVRAISYRKIEATSDSIRLLKKDIDNSICHIFGEHNNCAHYFCKPKEDENQMQKLRQYPEFLSKLNKIISQISVHSRSLIQDVDSNVVEHFNSRIAKFIGAKRINFSKRGSYLTRCMGAVVSFNSKTPHTIFGKNFYNRKKYGSIIKKIEARRLHEINRNRELRQNAKKKN